jgi:hypothetical protein
MDAAGAIPDPVQKVDVDVRIFPVAIGVACRRG